MLLLSCERRYIISGKNSNQAGVKFLKIIGFLFFLTFLFWLSISQSYVLDFDTEPTSLERLMSGLKNLNLKNILKINLVSSEFKSAFAFSTIPTLIFMNNVILKEDRKFKRNEEYGSAEFLQDKDSYNKEFTFPKGKKKVDTSTGTKNQILGQTTYLSMVGFETRRNNNMLVIGGSGAGKSRFFVIPNLLQANSSFVVTDPKGELLETTGTFLKEQGYEIKVFNLINMKNSLGYNPFHYINDDADVLKMINTYMKNTNDGRSGGDPFWEKAEQTLLQALAFYLFEKAPPSERNFQNMKELLDLADVREDDEEFESPLDIMFEELQEENPDSIAAKFYYDYKIAAGKTAKSILITAKTRMSSFNIGDVANLTYKDELDLGTLGDKKTALFIIIPSSDDTYNFLVAMMYAQMFDTLYHHIEELPGKKPKHHVAFYLDEFANIGEIPDFEKVLATMRSYELSAKIIIQNMAQLKTMYDEAWESIVGNCDTMIFLGGQEEGTLDFVSKRLGKETIYVENRSRSYSRQDSRSTSYQKLGRELMTPDELQKMDNQKCLIFVRGVSPIYDNKYELTKHPNYKLSADYDDSRILKPAEVAKELHSKTDHQNDFESELAQQVLSNKKDVSKEVREFLEKVEKEGKISHKST